jgi:hypothetical protein
VRFGHAILVFENLSPAPKRMVWRTKNMYHLQKSQRDAAPENSTTISRGNLLRGKETMHRLPSRLLSSLTKLNLLA